MQIKCLISLLVGSTTAFAELPVDATMASSVAPIRLQINNAVPNPYISWDTQFDGVYELQAAASIDEDWTSMGEFIGNGWDEETSIQLSGGSRFFRILTRGQALFDGALRVAPVRNIIVRGDSLSTHTLWPRDVFRARLPDGPRLVADSVGGSDSNDILSRATIEKLIFPIAGEHALSPGPQKVRTFRYTTGRLDDLSRRNGWLELTLGMGDPPVRVDFFNNGVKVGESHEPDSVRVTTNYEVSKTRFYADEHGLVNGQEIYFDSPDFVEPRVIPSRWPVDVIGPSSLNVYTRAGLPVHVVWRRRYFVANVEPDSFEIKERLQDPPLEMGSDATIITDVVTGFSFDWEYSGGPWEISIQTFSARDMWTHIFWVGTNDLVDSSASQVDQLKENVVKLIERIKSKEPRFVIIPPLNGAYEDRGPGSVSFADIIAFEEWAFDSYPDYVIDVRAALFASRPESELALLADPSVDEYLRIGGTPSSPIVDGPNATGQWVGPNYLPIIHRPQNGSNWDKTHPDFDREETRNLVVNTILDWLNEKGW
jgi:hypothetical protein